MHMGHARVAQAVEALDQAINLHLQFVRPNHRPVNGGVKRRSVATGGQYSDSFHVLYTFRLSSCSASSQSFNSNPATP